MSTTLRFHQLGWFCLWRGYRTRHKELTRRHAELTRTDGVDSDAAREVQVELEQLQQEWEHVSRRDLLF